MYYPYFRGKQYDLITIRECAEIMASRGFVPIIEPVKEATNGLVRAIDAVNTAGGEITLIVNPQYGDLATDPSRILDLLNENYEHSANVYAGILLTDQIDCQQIEEIIEAVGQRKKLLIHAGFNDARGLQRILNDDDDSVHVFLDGYSGRLYARHFSEFENVIIKNGFEKRANRLHPAVEFFSDLHVTFEEDGATGFGDYLIVGDEYSESGGPAYAVAIHLTFIDADQDDGMYIHHFKSDRFETPTDPAGKFAEALQKLVEDACGPNTKIFRSSAVEEFIELHQRGHFPGLGYVKKLSMQHHIEVLADYFHGRE